MDWQSSKSFWYCQESHLKGNTTSVSWLQPAVDIHTDARDLQLGAVISQKGKHIAFFSRKLSPAQTWYTTTEKELLVIVETLKEFKKILLGHQQRVFTDHKNLIYKTQNSSRVMRWRFLIEYFGPKLNYLPGEKNIVADCLSRLNFFDSTGSHENFALDQSEVNNYPLSYKLLMQYQQKYKKS